MDLLTKLITLTYWRVVIRPKAVAGMTDVLELHLKQWGCNERSTIPEEVRAVLVQEACRRAAEREKDKRARYGPFYEELEIVARQVVAVFDGEPNADSRIKAILTFHHVI